MNRPGSKDSLNVWLRWLEAQSSHEIVLGLDRVRDVLGRLRLSGSARVIHVAGTNGKGSCVAMLEALLREAGESTGAYTSPHLLRFNERIRVDGEEASDEQITDAFAAVEAVRAGVPLTYFEFSTLAALTVFDRSSVDSAILEIGMGGRLDAVNAVDAAGSIITNVSLDHCDWLGEDIESIAAEKAGIMRPGLPVIFGSESVPMTIVTRARELQVDLRAFGRDFTYTRSGETWSWSGRRRALSSIGLPALSGSCQLQNASMVLALVEAIGPASVLEEGVVTNILADIALPGRFQRIERNATWLLDVAHNAAAAEALAASLERLAPPGRTVAVIGMLADKDIEGIVRPLRSLVDRWIAVPVDALRAFDAGELARRVANCSGRPCLVADSITGAMDEAGELAGTEDLVLVAGSFYVVGPALELLMTPQ